MGDVKWIKIVTDMFNHRKIKQIEAMPDADAVLIIWVKLLCLAGSINESGAIVITKEVPYTDEMLAQEFARPLNTIRMALSIFEKYGMIEIVDNVYCISNWERYQNIEGMEKIREQGRIRTAKYRQKKAIPADCDVTVTLCDAIELDKNKKKKIFIAPSLSDVAQYCIERKNTVDPQRFIDHYESVGWKIGNRKMVDWRAAVRTWENRIKDNSPAQPQSAKPVHDYDKWAD